MPAPEVWGEAQLIDALRLNFGEDHADEYRAVLQVWFDRGNGVAIFERTEPITGYPPYTFSQQAPDGTYEIPGGMTLVAHIPGSPIPTVQAP